MAPPVGPILTHVVVIKTGQDISLNLAADSRTRNELVNKLINYIQGIHDGALPGDLQVDVGDSPAVGWWLAATASGVVGVNIGGTAVTVTAAGGDAATASALAAAINANATLAKIVRAAVNSTDPNRVLIWSRFPGTAANATTLATSGAGTGQSVSGASLGATNTAPAHIGTVGASVYLDYYGYDVKGLNF